MRKQTKIAAVASAAALLAIGATMTSFAATGEWRNEDGTWYYYDKDGNRVSDEWKPSNGNWYWLDGEEDGAMAVDKLIEDNNEYYYVDETGAMVRNQWHSFANEDQDDDTDPAEYRWYYFQASGKAYKNSGNDNLSKKTIDGKRYAFDDQGRMLYGWVDETGEMLNDDDGWKTAEYYFGDWGDGAMRAGQWERLIVYDDREGKDDDYSYWFNFKSNGKKRTAGTKTDKDTGEEVTDYSSTYTYKGHKYHFDECGAMVYQWVLASESNGDAAASASNWRYFNSPEDGARVAKDWFKVVPPTEDNSFNESDNSFAYTDSTDETERWYYADGNGKLYEGIIKNIGGKYYAFAPEEATSDGDTKGGHMLTGLCVLQMEKPDKANNITGDMIAAVIKENMDSDYLDDLLDGIKTLEPNQALYYFGNDPDADGSMKTGNVTISLDGKTYSFFFKKSGTAASGRGQGVTGIDDDKYIYKYGCRIKADSDDKYQLVQVTPNEEGLMNTKADKVYVTKIIDPTDYLDYTFDYSNTDDDTVRYADFTDGNYYLVNTSGNIQKNKSAAKDGNDCYFFVSDKTTYGNRVVYYTDNKNVKTHKDDVNKDGAVKGNSWKDIMETLDPDILHPKKEETK